MSRCAVVVCRWVLVPGVETAEGGPCGAEAGQGARRGGRVGAARARMVESIPALYRSWRWVMSGEARRRRRGRSRAGGMGCGWEAESACARRGECRAGMAQIGLKCCPILVHTVFAHCWCIFLCARGGGSRCRISGAVSDAERGARARARRRAVWPSAAAARAEPRRRDATPMCHVGGSFGGPAARIEFSISATFDTTY